MTNKTDVLVLFSFDERLIAALEADFNVHRIWAVGDKNAFFTGPGKQVRGIVCSALTVVDTNLMDRLPALRIVASFGSGFDRIDLAAAVARGIAVTNVQATNSGCVADMAIGLLIAAMRQIIPANAYLRDGRWAQSLAGPNPHPYDVTPRFYGRRMGIVGCGQIGEQIAKRAMGFDIEVGYHNRRERPELPYRYFASIFEMAAWCDYLMVSAPGGTATHHMVDAAVLDALGPDGWVANVGRGTVIDQRAMIERLQDGRLRGAALDVLEGEPAVPPELLLLPNVALTPHSAGVTLDSGLQSMAQVARNLNAAFAGERPPTQVN
jgi:lactate dehydrogenase-like 2-hydroxyacid dehydrogenase